MSSKWCDFGVFIVNKEKLLFDNTVVFRYKKNKNPIRDMCKNKQCSPDICNKILEIIDSDQIYLDNLIYKDYIYMENIIRRAKLMDTKEYKKPSNEVIVNMIRNRLQVIQGSVLAGNDNNENMLDDIRELLQKLLQYDNTFTEADYYKITSSF